VAEIGAEAPPEAVTTVDDGVRASLTILVVDDDMLVLTNTADMLVDLGHTVLKASSGPEALASLGTGQAIDLVLTDHAMPEMTGLQLAGQIRAEHPELPIVLISGYVKLPPEIEIEIPVLRKPFAQDALQRVIASNCPAGAINVIPFRTRTSA
jgi:CheY-like chemotaxis protein